MAGLQSVLRTHVDGHYLILGRVGHCRAAIDGHHSGIHFHLGGAGGVAQERTSGCGQQAVARADFLLGGRQVHGGGDVFRRVSTLTVWNFFERLAANQFRFAQVLGFVPQHFGGYGVLERHGIAEHTVVPGFARLCQHGRRGVSAHINTVTRCHQHALFRGCDHAWGAQQHLFVHHERLHQERLDEVLLECGQRGIGQTVAARAGRDAHGFGFVRAAGAQAGVAAFLDEVQRLAREDQVRVGDGLEVHAPELGPAPGALEVHA